MQTSQLTSGGYNAMSDPLRPAHRVDPGRGKMKPKIFVWLLAVLILHMDTVGYYVDDLGHTRVGQLPLVDCF